MDTCGMAVFPWSQVSQFLTTIQRYKLTHLCSAARADVLKRETEISALLEYLKNGTSLAMTINHPPFPRRQLLSPLIELRLHALKEGVSSWHLARARIAKCTAGTVVVPGLGSGSEDQ
eukprot:Protomagalhaensia_sp_Gyna_25__2471@NODE_2381_length_1118_cov_3_799815_g1975_i0_p1_GENE_NODE_2381_length_1118_cov_3_799815_g1975_i0NODE_2381_length_1118_cov_3_799815_g1975_i0_p1_ORF_typecomplete_len118_score17_57_NODE_2381_length_1118_cov_3_799815_g1975_i0459812